MSRFYAGVVICASALLGTAVSSGTLLADDSLDETIVVIDQEENEDGAIVVDRQVDRRDRNRPEVRFGDRNGDRFGDRRNDEGYFCIFEKIDSSFRRMDAFRGFGYSQLSACNDAEVQCRRSLFNSGENCRQYSSGWFGWQERDTEVLCESKNGRATSCPLGGRALNTGSLYHRHSQSSCTKDVDWRVIPGDSFISVQHGCRGDFIVKIRAYREPDPIPLPYRPF